MRYYLDFEFHEFSKQPKLLGIPFGKPINTIEPISIGIVAEDGREYYSLFNDFDVKAAWKSDWLRDNVLSPIYNEFTGPGDPPFLLPFVTEVVKDFGKSKASVAADIVRFVGKDPEFYAYYADYDWVVFCWLFGRMIDLPDGFPMFCMDLWQIMKMRGLDFSFIQNRCPQPKNIHNALEDARWNKRLHECL